MSTVTASSSRSVAPRAVGGGRCRLRSALGQGQPCAGPGCPFWEEGGAVVPAGCVVERLGLDVEGRPQLAWALHHVLVELTRARDRQERDEALALFDRLVPAAREEGR